MPVCCRGYVEYGKREFSVFLEKMKQFIAQFVLKKGF